MSHHYDVCIVGAGPSGLACLSAIREPYSVDHLTDSQVTRATHFLAHQKTTKQKPLSVCVVDPNSSWMQSWKADFAQLRIRHLRSPVTAHPDLFDSHALFSYAFQHGREDELYESGCFDCKSLLGLGQTQVGLWKLPSSQLFLDFCDDMARKLQHTHIQGVVIDIGPHDCAAKHDELYKITIITKDSSTSMISARNIVLATGMLGEPIIPQGMPLGPNIFSWKDQHAFSAQSSSPLITEKMHVLVMGGGLTAVQAALRVLEEGHTCVLSSRRPLQEKHFDIPVEWFDRRAQNKCLSDFYHETFDVRLAKLKLVRNGGSVPAMYMQRISAAVADGSLSCWSGDISCQEYLGNNDNKRGLVIQYGGAMHTFDRAIIACGVSPDCKADGVMRRLLVQWPIPVHGGFPDITQDLQWSCEGMSKPRRIFVCGAMSALQVGPDAGNLMGIRRAALKIAHTLACRQWLRESTLINPFASFSLLLGDESDTDDAESDDCLSGNDVTVH